MKRVNGTGSVEYHNGAWRIRVTIMVGNRRRRRTLMSGIESEARAQELLDAHSANVRDGITVAPGVVTLAQFGNEWLDAREIEGSKLRAKVKSLDSERSAWKHVLASDLGAMPIQAMEPRHVEAFAKWLRKRTKVLAITKRDGVELRETTIPIGEQTQKHVRRLVVQVLDSAIEHGVIEVNPAVHVVIARGRKKDVEEDWLRADEIEALLACEKIALRDRIAYACAIGLALRLDDMHAIRVEHVRLDCQVPGPHVEAVIAKPHEKRHRVPVLPWLRPWIEAQLASLRPGVEWLFPTRRGHRYGEGHDFGWAEKVETGRPRKESALELAGVDRRIRFHDLRGTCATHLALGTWGRVWTLHEIKSMLAHSDARVTERYVRRAVDELARVAALTPSGPTVVPGSPGQGEESGADPERFELSTFGSGGRGAERSTHGDPLRSGPRGDHVDAVLAIHAAWASADLAALRAEMAGLYA